MATTKPKYLQELDLLWSKYDGKVPYFELENWYKNKKENLASVEVNGRWIPAKQEPYQLFGIEWLLCKLGFHEWMISKKYAHTKVCFRCGWRNQNYKFPY